MVVRLVSGILFSVFLALFSFLPTLAQVKPTPVSLDVPDATLTLVGYAAPGALVTFTENGSVIGTATADANGYYSYVLTSQMTGVRQISSYFDDADNNRSQATTQSVSVQAQQNTNLGPVVLAPTSTRLTPFQVQRGSVVQVSGYTAAGASVTLTLATGQQLTTTAGVDGFYEFLIDTADLNDGDTSASVASMINSLASKASSPVSFTVVSPTEPATPDIIVSPEQLPPPIPQSPGDGDTISGDSITISGESLPNVQILIYENGKVVGSVLSDAAGRWSFEYQAVSSPVTLTFEACRDGVCSVLSRSLTLYFDGISTVCGGELALFELTNYRFWEQNEINRGTVQLDVLLTAGDGVLYVDWGDNTPEERFDHDANRPSPYRHEYRLGQYNGVARFVQGECERTRYFSVAVTRIGSSHNYWLLLTMFFVLFPFSYWSYLRGKQLMKDEADKAART